jgi:hypothetical protein
MKQARITISEAEAQPVREGARFAQRVADTGEAAAAFADALEGGGKVELEGPAEPLQESIHHALFDLAEELEELISKGPKTPFDQVAEMAELIAGLARKAEGLEEVLS